MFLTVHSAAGLFISQTVPHPVWSFFCSLFSHYLLDIIPHGDEGIGWWIHARPRRIIWIGLTDICLAALLVLSFFYFKPAVNTWTIIFALFGSVLPDFLSEANHQMRHIDAPFHRFFSLFKSVSLCFRFFEAHKNFHHRLHWLFKRHFSWRVGLFIQIAYAIGFFSLALTQIKKG